MTLVRDLRADGRSTREESGMPDRRLSEEFREVIEANEAAGLYATPALDPREIAGKITDLTRRDEVLAAIALMDISRHHHVALTTDQRVVAMLEARVKKVERERDAILPKLWAAEAAEMAAEAKLKYIERKVERLERDLSIALGKMAPIIVAPPAVPPAPAPPPKPKAKAPVSPALRRAIDDMMSRPPPDPVGIAEERRIEAEMEGERDGG